jgi:hypothetical protein
MNQQICYNKPETALQYCDLNNDCLNRCYINLLPASTGEVDFLSPDKPWVAVIHRLLPKKGQPLARRV